MPTNMNEVLAYLEPDEPNYAQAAKLGPDALPYLKEIIDKQDVMLASKAAYLVSLIKSEESLLILEYAALNKNPTIRVAVASGIRNISENDANMLLDKFIEDKDVGVRKVTLKSVSKFKSNSIVSKVQKLLESDPEPSIRKLAS